MTNVVRLDVDRLDRLAADFVLSSLRIQLVREAPQFLERALSEDHLELHEQDRAGQDYVNCPQGKLVGGCEPEDRAHRPEERVVQDAHDDGEETHRGDAAASHDRHRLSPHIAPEEMADDGACKKQGRPDGQVGDCPLPPEA